VDAARRVCETALREADRRAARPLRRPPRRAGARAALCAVCALRADRIREDHASLRALARLASPGPAEALRFGRTLEAHVRFEERDVFEVAQRRLPDAALAAIAAACRARAASSGT
jgi:hypothetical protein